jgi:uncharacterized small protein (DUF1192 family)
LQEKGQVQPEEAMEEDDLAPKTLRPKPTDMDVMSIESLNDYIAELEAEIVRAREAIEAKQSWRGKADSFFKL